jgi:hypothetical protein
LLSCYVCAWRLLIIIQKCIFDCVYSQLVVKYMANDNFSHQNHLGMSPAYGEIIKMETKHLGMSFFIVANIETRGQCHRKGNILDHHYKKRPREESNHRPHGVSETFELHSKRRIVIPLCYRDSLLSIGYSELHFMLSLLLSRSGL